MTADETPERMRPTGGAEGRNLLGPIELDVVDRLGGYRELAAELGESQDDVRTWHKRNNYGLADLAVRSDLRPPLFDIPVVAEILRPRIAEHRGRLSS